MYVEILGIENASRVRVRSALGEFSAAWHGALPPIGAHRDAELDFANHFTWGVEAVPLEPQSAAMADGADGGVVIVATVEHLEEDGSLVLRLGPSIAMLTVFGDPPPLGTTIRLVAPAVTLYDTNI